MKLMIASDIHGSAFYCEKLLEAYRRSGAERLILLGDILYHGPRNDLPKGYDTKRVAAMLNAMADEITCVQGNCDAEVDQMVLEFPIQSGTRVEALQNRQMFLTHGHREHAEGDGSALPKELRNGDLLIHGHTHLPVAERRTAGGREFLLMNPGSVSIPKGGYGNSYGILDDRDFTIYDFDGQVIRSIAWAV